MVPLHLTPLPLMGRVSVNFVKILISASKIKRQRFVAGWFQQIRLNKPILQYLGHILAHQTWARTAQKDHVSLTGVVCVYPYGRLGEVSTRELCDHWQHGLILLPSNKTLHRIHTLVADFFRQSKGAASWHSMRTAHTQHARRTHSAHMTGINWALLLHLGIFLRKQTILYPTMLDNLIFHPTPTPQARMDHFQSTFLDRLGRGTWMRMWTG